VIDFYRVLGLPFGASIEQVRKAYREYAKHFHPDKHQNSVFFTERFKEIQRAYEVLTDSETRIQFERSFNSDSRSNEVALLKTALADLKEKFVQQAKELSESNIQIQSLKSQLDMKDGEISIRVAKASIEDSNGKEGDWGRAWKRYREIRNARKKNESNAVKTEESFKEKLVSWGIVAALFGGYYLISWLIDIFSKVWAQ
jgi:DnaJ-class molecular chaperone